MEDPAEMAEALRQLWLKFLSFSINLALGIAIGCVVLIVIIVFLYKIWND